MEPQFSWESLDRLAKTLQSIGYIVIVFGPIIGLVMLVMGETVIRLSGLAVIIGSILIALYHLSFALVMSALHDVVRHLPEDKLKTTA
jgi:hypothetical protein